MFGCTRAGLSTIGYCDPGGAQGPGFIRRLTRGALTLVYSNHYDDDYPLSGLAGSSRFPADPHWLQYGLETAPRRSWGVPSYAPTDPATVQITREQPTKPHVQIGEIVCEPSSLNTPVPKIEAKLQQAGAKIGANAVVIVVDRTQSVGAVVMGGWYNRQVSPIMGRVIVGVAIRYTQ